MIWIVVEADTIGLLASIQFTIIVLFKLNQMLAELIDNVEIRGEILSRSSCESVW